MISISSPIMRSTLRATAAAARRLASTTAVPPSVPDNVVEDILGAEQNPHPPAAPEPNKWPADPPSQHPGHILFNNPKTLYRLHVFSSRNNTIATFTRGNGNVIAWASGGQCGFKKSQRSGYEAGYQVAVKIFQRMEAVLGNEAAAVIELCFRGFGQGRDAVQRALLTSEGESIRTRIVTLKDRTPLKIGGTRSKKARRI
jgi:small subunit ribosomal protein S11